jgi:hypothetical protein
MIDSTAQHYTLAGAISNGFPWDETPEGKDYWNGVFREVMYGEKFEPNLTIEPINSVIESEVIESKNIVKEEISITTPKNEPIVLEVKSEYSEEEKGGNTPDLLSKYMAQKSEIN